jgi:purine-binding chemotaxis protein CheW
MEQANDSLIDSSPSSNDDNGIENQYLTFSLGPESYGIGIGYVLQIIGMQEITAMPEMPYEMKGFITLRGNVVQIVSLRAKFGKPEVKYNDRACIIILQLNGQEIGIIVDAINETVSIEPEQLSKAPSLGDNEGNAYINEVARISDGNVVLLVGADKLFPHHLGE